MPEDHPPPGRPNAGASIPIVEFLFAGSVVSTVRLHLEAHGGTIVYGLTAVPATRLGRSLPDWPEALSLAPDLSKRTN